MATYSIVPDVTTVNEGGTVTFTVTTTGVPDGTQLRWIIADGTAGIDILTITTASPLTSATQGILYSTQIDAFSLTVVGPYAFSIISGTLPSGLTLSPSGVLSGYTYELGTYDFTIRATGSSAQTSKAFTMVVDAASVYIANLTDKYLTQFEFSSPYSNGAFAEIKWKSNGEVVITEGTTAAVAVPYTVSNEWLVSGGSGADYDIMLTHLSGDYTTHTDYDMNGNYQELVTTSPTSGVRYNLASDITFYKSVSTGISPGYGNSKAAADVAVFDVTIYETGTDNVLAVARCTIELGVQTGGEIA